jgi:hypothetical protein
MLDTIKKENLKFKTPGEIKLKLVNLETVLVPKFKTPGDIQHSNILL